MADFPPSPDDGQRPDVSVVGRSQGSGVIFMLVALALVLAIGFFYLTNDDRSDRRADKVTEAASSVDDAVQVVGDAARNAADTLRKDD